MKKKHHKEPPRRTLKIVIGSFDIVVGQDSRKTSKTVQVIRIPLYIIIILMFGRAVRPLVGKPVDLVRLTTLPSADISLYHWAIIRRITINEVSFLFFLYLKFLQSYRCTNSSYNPVPVPSHLAHIGRRWRPSGPNDHWRSSQNIQAFHFLLLLYRIITEKKQLWTKKWNFLYLIIFK